MRVSDIVAMPPTLMIFAVLVFLLVLAVLWFVLPFAVFGIKDRLDRIEGQLQDIERSSTQMLHQMRKTNAILVAAHNLEDAE